jgi:RnfABCDGE-type electron transport complex B subunit
MGVLGFAFGLMLDVAEKKLQVPTDDRVSQIRACLSGANCGACGYAGCDAFAAAVVEGKVLPNGCLAGGSTTANAIAQIMNLHADFADPSVPV